FRKPGAGMACEASHMHLVDDCTRGRPAQRSIAFPVVRAGIDYHALHRCRGVVAFPASRLTAVVPGNYDSPAVWVEEGFGLIKHQPVRRIGWPLNAITVKLPRLHAGYEHMPVMVGKIGDGIERDDARGSGVILPVKEQQLHV